MLIEFRVANFRSFNEEQTFSLVAGGGEEHPGNLIPAGKFSLLKAAALYGANASGKSNLVKAFQCMQSFVLSSATKMNLGDPIPGIVPFRLAQDTREKPSSFEVTCMVGDTRFEYGFSATRQRVYEEWLNACPPPPNKLQGWIERRFDPKKERTELKCRGPLAKHKGILEERTRENGLVLSRGAEQNIKELTDLFLWFRQKLWCIDMSQQPTTLIRKTATRVAGDQRFEHRVLGLLRHGDTGIDGVVVSENPAGVEKLPKVMQVVVSTISEVAPSLKYVPEPVIRTMHHAHGADAAVEFDMGTEESNGTVRLFALAGPVLDALDTGAALVVDELECSMHPLLVRKLIELFQSPEVNKKGAQLVFATHDSTLMDPDLFRRDQIWLVERNRSGASQLFSLYDFDKEERPRSTTAFQRNYLAGRYGGVPSFGPTFEDLQLQ